MRATSEITQESSSFLSGPDCGDRQPTTPTIKTISLSEDPPTLHLFELDGCVKSPEAELNNLDDWGIDMAFDATVDIGINSKFNSDNLEESVSGGASVFLENEGRRTRFMSERYLGNSVFGFLKQRKLSTRTFNADL